MYTLYCSMYNTLHHSLYYTLHYRPQCDHFQQFYNRSNVKVHVPIIRWSHCADHTMHFTTHTMLLTTIHTKLLTMLHTKLIIIIIIMLHTVQYCTVHITLNYVLQATHYTTPYYIKLHNTKHYTTLYYTTL